MGGPQRQEKKSCPCCESNSKMSSP
jgi:hypothetical protein